MKLLIVSDIHANPLITEQRKAKIKQLMEYCEQKEKEDYQVILAGDILDILEFGIRKLLADDFCRNVWAWANERERLRGNHDNEYYLPKFKIIDGIYIAHGHQWDYLWSKIPIYRFPLPDWLIRKYRTPAKKKGQLLDYHLATAQIEYEAMKFCIKKGYRACLFGHTHSPFTLKREGYILANSGDLVDSFSFLKIDNETFDLCILH